MRYLLFVIFLTFLFAGAAAACDPEPGAQHFPSIEEPPPRIQSGFFAVYNSLSGLPCNAIRSILPFDVKDKTFTIVGTLEKGLMIFDGRRWHQSGGGLFRFPEVTVTAMTAIDENSFLIGTPAGLFKGTFANNTFDFTKTVNYREANLNVLSLARSQADKEQFLIGSDRVVGTIINDGFVPFQLPQHNSPMGFSAIISHKIGDFIGCNGGLFLSKAGALTPFFREDDVTGWVNGFAANEKKIIIAAANGVFEMDENRKVAPLLPGIWSSCVDFSEYPDLLFSASGALLPVNGSTSDMVEEVDVFATLRSQYATLQQDYANYINTWSGLQTAPREAVDAMYQRFFEFEAQMREAMENARSETQPLLKGLWIGTQEQGLVIYATNGQRYHLTRENSKLPAEQITAIACRKSGETWVGTENAGILRYASRSIGNVSSLKKVLSCSPTRIRVLSDILLIGTRDKGAHLYRVPSADNEVQQADFNPLRQSANDVLEQAGLEELGHFHSGNTPGFHSHVTDFAVDKDGALWITGDKGVMIWNGKAWKRPAFANSRIKTSRPATRVTIDSQNRTFVAFSGAVKSYEQIYFYDGEKLDRIDPEAVAAVMALPARQRAEAMKKYGLSGVYMREFDVANASASVAAFEEGSASPVSALLNIEHYLLIGHESGQQKIFDGQSFRELSIKGTGRIGAIKNIIRLPSGIIAIQAADGISEFDGQHYRLIETAASGPGFKINDITLDTFNPETYIIGFSDGAGGGFARLQNSFWEKYHTSFAVSSVAQSDHMIFLASEEGVYCLTQ